ncbi:MAG: hypothetical protein HYU30_10550 [Chloroflexi bacterium]|nr:hypothetical protein [Chloroflexota bacterium]
MSAPTSPALAKALQNLLFLPNVDWPSLMQRCAPNSPQVLLYAYALEELLSDIWVKAYPSDLDDAGMDYCFGMLSFVTEILAQVLLHLQTRLTHSPMEELLLAMEQARITRSLIRCALERHWGQDPKEES